MPEEVTPEEFRRVLSKGTIAVKARLLDQSKIAGVGNLLADETLWQARISPRGAGGQPPARGRQPPLPRAAGRAEVRGRATAARTPAR